MFYSTLINEMLNGQNALAQSTAETTVAPTTTTGAPKQPGTLEMFLPFIFIFAIFYFLILRPQAKRQKQQQSLITSLKRGDSVVTNSGILGVIDGLTDTVVILEVDEGVKIRVLRTQIAGLQTQPK
jgi:preprotein translocase subunit YajC